MNTLTCFHNYPYVDENPLYYELVINNDADIYFDGCHEYRCKHCGKIYICDIFTKEGNDFEKKYNQNTN